MLSFILLSLPGFAFAASGACSGHGGVDCSAGRDSDGSVICNDGWENSSVSYASMKMCGQSSTVSRPVVDSVVAPVPVEVIEPTPTSIALPIAALELSPKTLPIVEKEIAEETPVMEEGAVIATEEELLPVIETQPFAIQEPIPTLPVVEKKSFWKSIFSFIFSW